MHKAEGAGGHRRILKLVLKHSLPFLLMQRVIPLLAIKFTQSKTLPASRTQPNVFKWMDYQTVANVTLPLCISFKKKIPIQAHISQSRHLANFVIHPGELLYNSEKIATGGTKPRSASLRFSSRPTILQRQSSVIACIFERSRKATL